MAKYVPTPKEQAAIDMLYLAGYVVVRQRTYNGLQESVRRAKQHAEQQDERRKDIDAWARDSLSEERRLRDRLTDVCTSAASLGVPIDAINAALRKADRG